MEGLGKGGIEGGLLVLCLRGKGVLLEVSLESRVRAEILGRSQDYEMIALPENNAQKHRLP